MADSGYLNKGFSMIQCFFNVHCCCIKISFRTAKDTIMSVLSILCDLSIMIAIIAPYVTSSVLPKLVYKRLYSSVIMLLCALCFRIWVRRNGKTLYQVFRVVKDMKLTHGSKKNHHLRGELATIYAVHVIYHSILVAVCVSSFDLKERSFLCHLYKIYVYEPAWVNACTCLLFLHNVWFILAPPSTLIIYYFFVCLALEDSLKTFSGRLRTGTEDLTEALDTYDSVTRDLRKVNGLLHTPLLFVAAHLLLHSFYGVYSTVYDAEQLTSKTLQFVFIISWNIAIFSLMCTSGSRVCGAYETIRNLLHRSMRDDEKFANLSVALMLCQDERVGFHFIDSIPLTRSLVVKSFGVMLTYSIMIATLIRANSENA